MHSIPKILFPLLASILLFCFMNTFYQKEDHQVFDITVKQKEDIIHYEKEEIKKDVLGVLEIPEIQLKMPIYTLNSKENNVDKNITLLKESILPPSEKSEIILAAHSGTGPHAYFKNLDKVKEKSIISFSYQNQIYRYEVIAKKEVLKNGTISLENYEKPHIVLITCSKTNDQIQEVYTGILIDQKVMN